MSDDVQRKQTSPFSLVLYILSGLVLILGVLLLFMLFGAAQAVTGYDMFFQLAGIEELAQAVLRPLQAGLINISILVFVLMLAIAGLLFTAGRLVARQAGLSERVRLLAIGDNSFQDGGYDWYKGNELMHAALTWMLGGQYCTADNCPVYMPLVVGP